MSAAAATAPNPVLAKGTVQLADLQRALRILGQLTRGHRTMPVTQAILVTPLRDDQVSLTATDWVTTIRVTIPAECRSWSQPFLLPCNWARRFAAMAEGPITYQAEGRKFRLTSGPASIAGATFDVGDYPKPRSFNGAGEVGVAEFEAEPLARALRACLSSVAATGERPILTTVQVRFRAERSATLVGSDGFRLTAATVDPAFAVLGEETSVLLIPAETLQHLVGVLGAYERVRMSWDAPAGQVLMTCKDSTTSVEVQAGLMDGTWPDWERLIPRDLPTTVTVPVAGLQRAMRMVAPVAREGEGAVRLETRGSSLRVSTSAMDLSAETALLAECTGPAAKIAFNWRYLLDALSHMEGDAVISIGSPNAQALFRSASREGIEQCVMPMMVRW